MSDIEVTSGIRVKGIYEVREGRCPKCHTYFDDVENKPSGDKRWCPRCKEYRLGRLKGNGKF